MTYHVLFNGQPEGPFPEAEIRRMLEEGRMTPEDLVWHEGLETWNPVGQVLPARRPVLPPSLPAVIRPRVWPWVAGSIALVAALAAGSFFLITFFSRMALETSATDAPRPLLEERAAFQTTWKKSSYEAAGPADYPPEGVFNLVRYPSPAGKLAAYVTPDPQDGKKHPAIVWAHGGFGGIGSWFWEEAARHNDQSARAFREAGIVLMAPSWRGENDNPGRFELFYGEVEDMLAAVAWVKTLPYVDPDRVYLGGHSTGGTMTLLASAASDQFRAAFSFGGMPDAMDVLANSEGYGNTPYDATNLKESRLRSPARYLRFMARPVFYFEGAESYYAAPAEAMGARAARLGVPFKAFTLPGTHFDILHPVTRLAAAKILQDTGSVCRITFSSEELTRAYDEAFIRTPAKALRAWIKNAGSLKETLDLLEQDDDGVPRKTADVTAIADTVRKVMEQPAGAAAAGHMAALARLCRRVEDEELLEKTHEQVIPLLADWSRRRLPTAGLLGENEAGDFLEVLYALVAAGNKAGPALVVDAARKGVGHEHHGWRPLLRECARQAEATRIMNDLSNPLPGGFIGVALLEAANAARLDDWKGRHPYDSDEGQARLRNWLTSTREEESLHAHSAAVALAHLSAPRRAVLMPLALQHFDPGVLMEAAWADLKNHGRQGLPMLQKFCLDVHRSKMAKLYLEELGRGEDVPPAALDPAFMAMAEMSGWLQHPNELGDLPLTLEVYDQRLLYWPPSREEVQAFLFKFTYRFSKDEPVKTGYGMVGGMTWAFFKEHPAPPRPEDLYVQHCALELARNDGGRTEALAREREAEARERLKNGNPGKF